VALGHGATDMVDMRLLGRDTVIWHDGHTCGKLCQPVFASRSVVSAKRRAVRI
jgi:hypothetical protein